MFTTRLVKPFEISITVSFPWGAYSRDRRLARPELPVIGLDVLPLLAIRRSMRRTVGQRVLSEPETLAVGVHGNTESGSIGFLRAKAVAARSTKGERREGGE